MEDPMLLDGIGSGRRGPRAKWEVETRKKHKIAQVRDLVSSNEQDLTSVQRQFDRLLELLLLKQLDRKDEGKVRSYRLQVKSRLYRFNYVSAHVFV